MSSSTNRYGPNNEEFQASSNVGIADGDQLHPASPQGKAIRKKQKVDHVQEDKREHRNKMELIHQLLMQRGGGKNQQIHLNDHNQK